MYLVISSYCLALNDRHDNANSLVCIDSVAVAMVLRYAFTRPWWPSLYPRPVLSACYQLKSSSVYSSCIYEYWCRNLNHSLNDVQYIYTSVLYSVYLRFVLFSFIPLVLWLNRNYIIPVEFLIRVGWSFNVENLLPYMVFSEESFCTGMYKILKSLSLVYHYMYCICIRYPLITSCKILLNLFVRS